MKAKIYKIRIAGEKKLDKKIMKNYNSKDDRKGCIYTLIFLAIFWILIFAILC